MRPIVYEADEEEAECASRRGLWRPDRVLKGMRAGFSLVPETYYP
jgi:hypothetical protein